MADSQKYGPVKGQFYWKSLREFHNDPATVEAKANEFMAGVTDDFKLSGLSDISRRKFLALLTASASFAAASCSSYENKGEVIPYNKEPVGVIPGVANYYASTCTGCKNACGILVKTREGRPIKINGNDEHPVNKGKICARGQASILNLYDPERIKDPQKKSGGSFSTLSWTSADEEIIHALRNASSAGKEIAIIAHTFLSPSGKDILDQFVDKYRTTKLYSYELFNDVNRQVAWLRSYNSGDFPLIAWDKAKLILTLEADILGNEGHTIEQTRLFASTRNKGDLPNFSRLVSAESGMSITGMNADIRLRLKPALQYEFVLALLNEFVVQKQISRFALDKNIVGALQGHSINAFAAENGIDGSTLDSIVGYMTKYRSTSIVYAGDRLPEPVHVAVNLLNEVLGSTSLYRTDQSRVTVGRYSTPDELKGLVSKMNDGNVGAVIHYETNPVFHFPQDLGYSTALGKVPAVVTMAQAENESSAVSDWVLPTTHDLESWNDFKTRTGFRSLQQPVIYPLFQSRQKEAVLLTWISGNSATYRDAIYHDYLMNSWEKKIYPSLKLAVDFKTFWYSALHDGVSVDIDRPQPTGTFKTESFTSLKAAPNDNGYSVVLAESYLLGDGRFANNGWLQELPHPVTKVVWDNYAAISPTSAKQLGVDYNDLIEVLVDGREVKLPVFVQPGMADKLIAVELGYGRKKAGTVGSDVGVNALELVSFVASFSPWIYTGAKITKSGESYPLITTMEHNFIEEPMTREMQSSRGIIREGTVEEFEKDPGFIRKEREEAKPTTIYKNFNYNDIKWAMSIDLNKCTGCSACVISCNVENNIPVVGKDQVAVSREMQWLRIDRYYSGDPVIPKISLQPMLCQQCDDAPCENVCPVGATTHSPDGLNMMVYNRCVGTRYCSNNCPYKVRRFNFFNFRKHYEGGYFEMEPAPLVSNPEVTVRTRGVMEKCTFCVQRIVEGRQEALQDGRTFKGSDVITACQEACPADAIVFGDANDKSSEVAKMREHPLGYYVLEQLDTKPNVTYLAKLKNI
ncbi:MAG TPA: TAT-variant-translocated molybdopterin oxidoreductase [Candidatus Kryptonia bacterium]